MNKLSEVEIMIKRIVGPTHDDENMYIKWEGINKQISTYRSFLDSYVRHRICDGRRNYNTLLRQFGLLQRIHDSYVNRLEESPHYYGRCIERKAEDMFLIHVRLHNNMVDRANDVYEKIQWMYNIHETPHYNIMREYKKMYDEINKTQCA